MITVSTTINTTFPCILMGFQWFSNDSRWLGCWFSWCEDDGQGSLCQNRDQLKNSEYVTGIRGREWERDRKWKMVDVSTPNNRWISSQTFIRNNRIECEQKPPYWTLNHWSTEYRNDSPSHWRNKKKKKQAGKTHLNPEMTIKRQLAQTRLPSAIYGCWKSWTDRRSRLPDWWMDGWMDRDHWGNSNQENCYWLSIEVGSWFVSVPPSPSHWWPRQTDLPVQFSLFSVLDNIQSNYYTLFYMMKNFLVFSTLFSERKWKEGLHPFP